MPTGCSPELASTLNRTTTRLGSFVIAVALAAMLGWVFDIALLRQIAPGMPTMKPNTALCFALAGATLLAGRRSPTLATLLSVALVLISGLTLSEYLLDWTSGIDQLLFPVPTTDAAPPGRMSAATAAIFVVLGGGLLLQVRGERMIMAGQLLAALALCGALLSVLAYIFGANLARVMPFSSLALHTAVAFMLSSIGALLLHGACGWVAVFFQDTISARMARRHMVSVLAALPVLGGLCVFGESVLGLYGSAFGTAILTVISMAVLSVSIWNSARKGNAADNRINNLARINATLSGINSLIVRVREHDELFQEACRIAGEVGRFPWVLIATRPAGNDGLPVRIRASHAADAPQYAWLSRTVDDAQEIDTLVSPVLRTREALVVADLRRDAAAAAIGERLHAQLLASRIASLVVLPLTVADRVVGVYMLHSEVPQFFNEDEMHLLKELAGDIAFAINHIEKDKRLDYLAYYDPLTGLPNRTLLLERLGQALRLARRDRRQVALGVLDLRRFRDINESLGRQAGDELLCQIARRLQESMDRPDSLARLSADSFAGFTVSVGSGRHELQIRQWLNALSREPFVIEGRSLVISANAGIAIFPDDSDDAEKLILNAESALRQAQAAGEPMTFYTASMNASAAAALQLESRLRHALEHGEFVLHYQPKVGFGGRTVRQVEALMRWNDPENGLVPPGRFIPAMEEIGLIEQAGAWALEQAVRDIVHWQSMGLEAPRVAVNVSAAQLRSEQFPATVEAALAGFGDTRALLDIEVTESMVMSDVSQVTAILQAIRSMGVRIAVDDFGTGYSSLSYLAQLPINALKIDRSFVLAMDEAGPGTTIVASIISLAHALGLEVVAEGVETQSQADRLLHLKCDLMQGYLFSKPLPFDELGALLPRSGTDPG